LPLANQARQHSTVLERRKQLTVMHIQDDSLHAQNLMSLLHFVPASQRQRSARLPPMTDVAVGDRHEQDMVPLLCPHRCCAADLKLAIVRMGSKSDDAELAVIRRHRDAVNGAKRYLRC